jgi:hypothetical protein
LALVVSVVEHGIEGCVSSEVDPVGHTVDARRVVVVASPAELVCRSSATWTKSQRRWRCCAAWGGWGGTGCRGNDEAHRKSTGHQGHTSPPWIGGEDALFLAQAGERPVLSRHGPCQTAGSWDKGFVPWRCQPLTPEPPELH